MEEPQVPTSRPDTPEGQGPAERGAGTPPAQGPPRAAGPSPASGSPAGRGPVTALPRTAVAYPGPYGAGAWGDGPPVAVPRERGELERSITTFWAGNRLPAPPVLLGACVVVGVASAGLLVGHRAGLGAAVVGVLLWAAALPSLVRARRVGDLVLVLLSMALVAVAAVRDAGWVVAVCVAVAVWTASVALTSTRSASAVLLAPVGSVAGYVRALPWVVRASGALAGARRPQALLAVRSLAVTVGLLVVFGLLFASADPVFASYVPRWEADLLPAQVVVGLLVALAAAAAAHLVLAPPQGRSLTLPAASPARRGEWLLPVLGLDALVLAFVAVQVAAVVGGHRYVQETAGLAYAEYARTGFAQLVAATVLTLAVVAVAARRAPRETDRDRLLTRVALAVLCVATLGVVASALRRMDLYVEAYGLTRLRLFVIGFEVVLGVALLLVLVAGVRWRGVWLPRAMVHVVAVAALALAVVNPDALIVRHNLAADLAVDLDTGYLAGLSADAVPAMDEASEPLRSCLLSQAVGGALVQDSPVGGRLGTEDGFAGWNLGRERAVRVLEEGSPIRRACALV